MLGLPNAFLSIIAVLINSVANWILQYCCSIQNSINSLTFALYVMKKLILAPLFKKYRHFCVAKCCIDLVLIFLSSLYLSFYTRKQCSHIDNNNIQTLMLELNGYHLIVQTLEAAILRQCYCLLDQQYFFDKHTRGLLLQME